MDVEVAGEPLATRRIGRDVLFTGDRFVEREDTRIAPGDRSELTFPVPAATTTARVRVTVAPDAYYERFFTELLARPQSAEARRALELADKRAASSRYLLYDLTVTASSRSRP